MGKKCESHPPWQLPSTYTLGGGRGEALAFRCRLRDVIKTLLELIAENGAAVIQTVPSRLRPKEKLLCPLLPLRAL